MISPHGKLVARLVQAGDLPDHWRPSFEQVERHQFLPDELLLPDGTMVDRQADQDRWLEVAYDDTQLITQVDDGTENGAGYPTSSASMPSIVADMLTKLDVAPGMRVLEIGTGTGYNAGLLCHLLGDDAVTTIEVDPAVAEHARVRLASAGFAPLVVTDDGTQGWSARAPFDRVISTAAVKRVPYAWIVQTHPGGKILTPWGNSLHNGVLAHLEVGQSGSASGTFEGNVAFMWVRNQRTPRRALEAHVSDAHEFRTSHTDLYPKEPLSFDGAFAIGLHMPTVIDRLEFAEDPEDQRFVVYLIDPGSGSWASWHVDPRESSHQVRQHGPRHLFFEFEAAYQWWLDAGRPVHTRFGMSVSADHQSVWLDEPTNILSSLP